MWSIILAILSENIFIIHYTNTISVYLYFPTSLSSLMKIAKMSKTQDKSYTNILNKGISCVSKHVPHKSPIEMVLEVRRFR